MLKSIHFEGGAAFLVAAHRTLIEELGLPPIKDEKTVWVGIVPCLLDRSISQPLWLEDERLISLVQSYLLSA